MTSKIQITQVLIDDGKATDIAIFFGVSQRQSVIAGQHRQVILSPSDLQSKLADAVAREMPSKP